MKCHPQAAPSCPHSHNNSPGSLHVVSHPAHGQASVGSNNKDMYAHAALACLSLLGLGEFIDAQKAQKSEAASQKDEYSNSRGVRLVRISFS